jgi:hypothetical protein
MIQADASYFAPYSSEAQYKTVTALRERGWEVSHLFTIKPGDWLVWVIAKAPVTVDKPATYTHGYVTRDGKFHRYPHHRR